MSPVKRTWTSLEEAEAEREAARAGGGCWPEDQNGGGRSGRKKRWILDGGTERRKSALESRPKQDDGIHCKRSLAWLRPARERRIEPRSEDDRLLLHLFDLGEMRPEEAAVGKEGDRPTDRRTDRQKGCRAKAGVLRSKHPDIIFSSFAAK